MLVALSGGFGRVFWEMCAPRATNRPFKMHAKLRCTEIAAAKMCLCLTVSPTVRAFSPSRGLFFHTSGLLKKRSFYFLKIDRRTPTAARTEWLATEEQAAIRPMPSDRAPCRSAGLIGVRRLLREIGARPLGSQPCGIYLWPI